MTTATPRKPSAVIACSSGRVLVTVGDRFMCDKTEWEVAYFPGGSIYSPSGLGGTPTVACRATQVPDWWKQWLKVDGTIDWCGDSVATYILLGMRGNAVAQEQATVSEGEEQGFCGNPQKEPNPLYHKERRRVEE